MKWLRDWLKAWLEIPDPHPAKKLSGAMYAEIRAARKALDEAQAYIRSQTDEARSVVREMSLLCARQNMANSVATADYENTLYRLHELGIKFDALVAAMGVVIVPGPEQGDEPTIAPIGDTSRIAEGAHVLDAKIALGEIRGELAKARSLMRTWEMEERKTRWKQAQQ